ncbi:MAG: nuclear transport factor 2 family protein, partial [Flavobacteriales bacterium]
PMHLPYSCPSPLRFLLLLAVLQAPFCWSQQDEEAAVIAVVARYFETMGQRDAEGMRAILTTEGMFHGKYADDPSAPTILMPHGPYLERLARDTVELKERFWDPVVNIDGPIATLTTPYDFCVGRKLKHCGIDHFTLVREADGWKISGGVFSMQRTGCPESPLGPAY